MTKILDPIVFDPTRCRLELAAFERLLQPKKLSERADIQKFFKKHKQLSAFIGTFVPNIGPATLLAYEFPFMGDFSADIVLGNQEKGVFCVIEFEDGKPDSIFTKVRKKSTTEWSRRFEHGFSWWTGFIHSTISRRRKDSPGTSVTAILHSLVC